ncbi:MAG: hypothetical protein ACRBBQ_17710 [Cognatishimia sp.]
MTDTPTNQDNTNTNELVQKLAKAYGNQYLRRDNKFYDINHLGTPLSRTDVEQMVLNRIHTEHPETQLTNDVYKGLNP